MSGYDGITLEDWKGIAQDFFESLCAPPNEHLDAPSDGDITPSVPSYQAGAIKLVAVGRALLVNGVQALADLVGD